MMEVLSLKRLGMWLFLLLMTACSSGQTSHDGAEIRSESLVLQSQGHNNVHSQTVVEQPDSEFEVDVGQETVGTIGDESTESSSISIVAAGDLVVSRRLSKALEQNGLDHMLEAYKSVLDRRDIAFMNLETPLVDDVVPLRTGWPPILGSPPGIADSLARIGVDVVSVANNHSYDQGHLGLQRTLKLLERSGIVHAGVGTSRELAYGCPIIERRGLKIAFCASTAVMNIRVRAAGAQRHFVSRLWHEDRIFDGIASVRDEADIVVVSLHWSRDFERRVTRRQREKARRFVDAGADLILGTGPHVIHEVERVESSRGDAVIAYSLGNLLSSMGYRYRVGMPVGGYVHPANVLPDSRDIVVLKIPFYIDESGQIEVEQLSAIPFWTLNNAQNHRQNGEPLDIRLIPLDQAPRAIAEERQPLISDALGSEVELRAALPNSN